MPNRKSNARLSGREKKEVIKRLVRKGVTDPRVVARIIDVSPQSTIYTLAKEAGVKFPTKTERNRAAILYAIQRGARTVEEIGRRVVLSSCRIYSITTAETRELPRNNPPTKIPREINKYVKKGRTLSQLQQLLEGRNILVSREGIRKYIIREGLYNAWWGEE